MKETKETSWKGSAASQQKSDVGLAAVFLATLKIGALTVDEDRTSPLAAVCDVQAYVWDEAPSTSVIATRSDSNEGALRSRAESSRRGEAARPAKTSVIATTSSDPNEGALRSRAESSLKKTQSMRSATSKDEAPSKAEPLATTLYTLAKTCLRRDEAARPANTSVIATLAESSLRKTQLMSHLGDKVRERIAMKCFLWKVYPDESLSAMTGPVHKEDEAARPAKTSVIATRSDPNEGALSREMCLMRRSVLQRLNDGDYWSRYIPTPKEARKIHDILAGSNHKDLIHVRSLDTKNYFELTILLRKEKKVNEDKEANEVEKKTNEVKATKKKAEEVDKIVCVRVCIAAEEKVDYLGGGAVIWSPKPVTSPIDITVAGANLTLGLEGREP